MQEHVNAMTEPMISVYWCLRSYHRDGMGYPPMHEHTIMHEIPIFFRFHYCLIQPR